MPLETPAQPPAGFFDREKNQAFEKETDFIGNVFMAYENTPRSSDTENSMSLHENNHIQQEYPTVSLFLDSLYAGSEHEQALGERFLKKQLSKEDIVEVERRAATWYEAQEGTKQE